MPVSQGVGPLLRRWNPFLFNYTPDGAQSCQEDMHEFSPSSGSVVHPPREAVDLPPGHHNWLC